MKKVLSAFLLLTFSTLVQAQTVNTNADEFATQSGVIAGAAQACGQDVSIFAQRVIQVINLLAPKPSDQQQAMTAFEKSMADAQFTQTRNHTLNCGTVIDSYRTLPLMQPDYQKTVLPALEKEFNITPPGGKS